MLSREVMGVLCLGVVWVTALLVAAAALQELADLRRIARRARKAVRGIAQDHLATWKVEQTGRALDADGDEVIAFHEKRFVSEIHGGKIAADGKDLVVEPTPSGEVWVSEDARRGALACADVETFDAVYAQARKAKGAPRDVSVRIGKGEEVFVFGNVVSTVDPVALCAAKSWPIVLFVPLELAACAAATWVALQPPHFGRTSILGAILLFAFFLGVTPLGVSLREASRRPHEAFLRAKWSRKALQNTRQNVADAQGLTQRKT